MLDNTQLVTLTWKINQQEVRGRGGDDWEKGEETLKVILEDSTDQW
jgi:hypothetical protein